MFPFSHAVWKLTRSSLISGPLLILFFDWILSHSDTCLVSLPHLRIPSQCAKQKLWLLPAALRLFFSIGLITIWHNVLYSVDFPSGSVANNLPANAGEAGDAGLIPGSGRSLGGGNGNLLQYSCQDNPIDKGAWWGYSLWGHKESDMTEHACRRRRYSVDTMYLVDFQYVPRWQLALSPFVTSVTRIVNIYGWNCDYFAKSVDSFFLPIAIEGPWRIQPNKFGTQTVYARHSSRCTIAVIKTKSLRGLWASKQLITYRVIRWCISKVL